MNERDFFRAIGNVDDDLIEAAGRPIRHRPVRAWLSVAVAACLCVVVLFLAIRVLPGTGTSTDHADTAVPRSGDSLSGNGQAPQEFVSDANPGSMDTEANSRLPGLASTSGAMGQESTAVSPNSMTSYGSTPQDFRFVLTWDGYTYDSASDLLTMDGQSYALLLTQEQRERAWNLLSGLESDADAVEGDIILEVTYDGQTCRTAVGEDDFGATLSICTELIRILESAPGWRAAS